MGRAGRVVRPDGDAAIDPEEAFKSWIQAAADGAATELRRRAAYPALAELISKREILRLRARARDSRVGYATRHQSGGVADGLEAATQKWSKDAYLRRWFISGLPRQPDPDILASLVRVVTEVLGLAPPHDVGLWIDFRLLVDELRRRREADARLRTIAVQERAATERAETLGGLLVIPPCRARDLPEDRLGLGSWAFDGRIPPYARRTADRALTEALTNKDRRLTILVGPPKAGKTRSFVEILKATMPDATVWWANTAPGIPARIADALEREVDGNAGNTASTAVGDDVVVVVLDDAHRCGTHPESGLTATILDRLVRRALVVATLHEDQLSAWEQDAIDHTIPGGDLSRLIGIGATCEFVKQVQSGRIDYTPELDPDEYAAAIETLRESRHSKRAMDGTLAVPATAFRLAEYLAAVDQLRARAHSGLSNGGYQGAIVKAALDAAVLYPVGAKPHELAQLARWNHRHIAPTRVWSDDAYERALDWATTPIGGPGSPHAIVTTNLDRTGYQLLDALRPHLLRWSHSQSHLLAHAHELPPSASFHAGLNLSRFPPGDVNEKTQWWCAAAEGGHVEAMIRLGEMYWPDEPDQAGRWLGMAAESGSTVAMEQLGIVHWSRGEPDQAALWWRIAADAGHIGAMNGLANLHRCRGERWQANRRWEEAANVGDPLAMFELGSQCESEGDSSQAALWYERGLAALAKSGEPTSYVNEIGIYVPSVARAPSKSFLSLSGVGSRLW